MNILKRLLLLKRGWKRGYKIINADDRGSVIIHNPIFYPKDEIVKRKMHPNGATDGPLAVFRNKKDAQAWCGARRGLLLHCLYLPSKEKDYWQWKMNNGYGHKMHCHPLSIPNGKDFAEKVIMLQ